MYKVGRYMFDIPIMLGPYDEISGCYFAIKINNKRVGMIFSVSTTRPIRKYKSIK